MDKDDETDSIARALMQAFSGAVGDATDHWMICTDRTRDGWRAVAKHYPQAVAAAQQQALQSYLNERKSYAPIGYGQFGAPIGRVSSDGITDRERHEAAVRFQALTQIDPGASPAYRVKDAAIITKFLLTGEVPEG